MKFKLSLIPGLLCLAFYSCVKPGDPAMSRIFVDKSELIMSTNQGYTDSFTVMSTIPWKLTIAPSTATGWMQVSATEGLSGNTIIKIKIVSATPPAAAQSATITIKPADNAIDVIPATVTIRQQAYNIEWQKRLGGSSAQEGFSIIPTSDGGYAALGHTSSNDGDVLNSHGSDDMWLVKLNAAGNVTWSKTFGGDNIEIGRSIIETPDHGFLLLGGTLSNNNGDVPASHGSEDFLAIRVDVNGNMIWSKTYGGAGYEEPTAEINATGGGFVITGYTSSNGTGDVPATKGAEDVWVFKIDDNGNILWNKTYGGTNNDDPTGIELISGGGFFVAGTTKSDNTGDMPPAKGDYDAFLLKLTETGDKVNCNIFGSDQQDEVIDIKAVNNEFVLLGTSWGNNSGDIPPSKGGEDVWLLKVDINGNKIWSKAFGGNDNDESRSLAATANGTIWVATTSWSGVGGDIPSANHGDADCWLIKLDADGNKLWTKLIGGASEEQPYSIRATADGGIVFTGATGSPTDSGDFAGAGNQRGSTDFWIAKLK